MNDPLLMGVLDGVTDLDEQLQPVFGVKPLPIAILGDPGPPDQFHHEVRPAALGRPGIVDLGDVRVIHHRQGLAFGLEPRHDLPGVHPQLDDLQRHPPPDRLLLLGHVDRPETAFADLLQQLVTADHGPGTFCQRLAGWPSTDCSRKSPACACAARSDSTCARSAASPPHASVRY